MTNKFLLYNLEQGGFITEEGYLGTNTIQDAALFSVNSAQKRGLDAADETEFLLVPMTQDYLDRLPFDLVDTDPSVECSATLDRESALSNDFVILTDLGFYDEKYNSMTNTSRPKVRSFDLDYANLYNKEQLEYMGRDWIIGDDDIIVPISIEQQEALKQLPAFDPAKEPYGFFMEPIPDTPKQEQDDMPSLDDALGALAAEQTETLEQ